MNARLDDQFDDEYPSFIGTLLAPLTERLQKPANIAWAVGGMITVGFVYSNALFFQHGAHPAALFSTRTSATEHMLRSDEKTIQSSQNAAPIAPEKQVTRIVFDENSMVLPQVAQRPTTSPGQVVAPTPKPVSAQLRELQKSLVELGFYNGTVDGLDGPKTRAAIEKYKANVGLRGIDLTYAELSLSAQNNLIVTAAIPKVRPQRTQTPAPVSAVAPYSPPKRGADVASAPKVQAMPLNLVSKVQAGLRAFGNDGVSVDGAMGPVTVAAIKEFQSLFDLPVSGKVDDSLIKKMTDVGLIDR